MSGLAANLIVTVGMLTSVVGSPSVTVVGKKIPSYVLAFSLLNVRSYLHKSFLRYNHFRHFDLI